ncbi:MAG: outer membrane protein assembly factor BamA [Bacteroidota bacterium]|nr:outer membrane protein assembly factor BamA [Bacteroidota bacterium]
MFIKILQTQNNATMHSLRNAFALIVFVLFSSFFTVYAQQIQITDPTLDTPEEYRISHVRVQGNQSTRTQFIINTSGLVEGKVITYPGDDIPNAINRLFQVGLFSDVKVFIENQSLTSLGILIQVAEQPRMLEYRIEGVKKSEADDLEDLISLVQGAAITDANLMQAKRTIIRFFKEKGLWGTEVVTRVEDSEEIENRSILYFDVKKGKKLEIKDIQFIGLDRFTEKDLLKVIKPIKEDAWWKFLSKKLYKQEDFDEGVVNLITHFQEEGHIDARIVSDSLWVDDFGNAEQGLFLAFTIYEGPQYKVRDISWDGNTVYTDNQLTQSLGFEVGDIFNQTLYDENLNFNKTSTDINSLYQNIGYLFFQAIPTISKAGNDSLDIHFDIYEDEIATIRKVTFSGNTQTHDDVVRRTLRTIPGATYSREAIVRSVRELSTLGFFDPQNITPDVQPIPQNKEVDVSFVVDESASTSNFEFSGGYGGRAIGALISTRLNFNNFSLQRALAGDFTPFPSGDGQNLSLGVQVTGTGFQSYSFGFVEPWLNGKPTSFGVNLSYNFIQYRGFSEKNRLFSSSVSLGKRLRWPDDYFSSRTALGYQLYDVQGTTSFLSAGTSSIISINQTFERNSLDNFISPNRGSKLGLSFEVAPPLPGLSEYYKIKTDYQYHIPIVEKLVLTSQVNFGFIGFFTNDRRSNFQRFLVGGTQLQQRQSFLYDNIDLRGYPGGNDGSIAPIIDGRQVGGRVYNKYSFELRYPAVSNEQLQLIPYAFYDAANAFNEFATFDPFNVKRAIGFGTRLYLPVLGLVDLSYGYRLDNIEGTNTLAGEWEFLFNIGAPF